MSHRNRRSNRSNWRAVLVLTLGVLLCACDADAQGRSQGAGPQNEQSASEQDAPRQTPYSTNYRQRCAEPQNHNEADLCQQWRSANAAELTAEFARRGYFWSVVQAVGLIVTLFLSGLATLLSLRAIAIAERDLTERDKPVLHIRFSHSACERAGYEANFIIRNIGERPATIDSITMAIAAPRFAPNPRDARRGGDAWAFVPNQEEVLEVGEEKSVTATRHAPFDDYDWAQITDPEKSRACFLFGFITYRDQMRNTRRRNVCIAMWERSRHLDRRHQHIYTGHYYDLDKRVTAERYEFRPIGWFRMWRELRQERVKRASHAAASTPPATE